MTIHPHPLGGTNLFPFQRIAMLRNYPPFSCIFASFLILLVIMPPLSISTNIVAVPTNFLKRAIQKQKNELLVPTLEKIKKFCVSKYLEFAQKCSQNLLGLIMEDKECSNYAKICLDVTPAKKLARKGRNSKNKALVDGQVEEEQQSRNGTAAVGNITTSLTEEQGGSSRGEMNNSIDGTEAGSEAQTEEPDVLPQPDFSLSRPPPDQHLLSAAYFGEFCRRFSHRFVNLCYLDPRLLDQYGAAFCPTYSERCGVALPSTENNKCTHTCTDAQQCQCPFL